MSHISHIEIEINDLDCLVRACAYLGFQFMRNQRTYKWYGRMVSPERHPLPEGLSENDLGKCTHAIRVPEAEYEVGVVKRGDRYLLLCDFWDSKLRQRLGENGGRLKQAYAFEKTRKEAKKRNYLVSEKKIENGIRLTLTPCRA